MKRKLICAALILALLLGLCPAAFAASGGSQSSGAPPAQFDIYIQVGDDTAESSRLLLGSVSGQQMRRWASGDTLKYSAASYYGNQAGRIVREWIALADFTKNISTEFGLPVAYQSGDYFIMGEDLTKDESLSGYDRATQTGNWYSYDSMIGTPRYYFPNWTSGSEEGGVQVPAVIGLKSYGGSSGMSDTMLDIYAGSADYLWAYVVYYGQTKYSETNYPYFYYGQDQASFRYERNAACNATIHALLTKEADAANAMIAETKAGANPSEVAEGSYCVDKASYNQLTLMHNQAQQLLRAESTTNGAAFDALLALRDAEAAVRSSRQPGTKSGYFWYTEAPKGTTTYTIATANQLWELCTLVNGTASDENSGDMYDQDSFEGKTIVLACDIDADGSRVFIGTQNYAFNGTFEGGGYTISNLSITNLGNGYLTGLFGHIGPQGTVRNLTAAGESGGARLSDYAGGLAGWNEGLIENCVSDMTVTASASARTGGVAAVNSGTIQNCVNLGAVTGGSAAGGIAGENSGTVTGCVNTGTVSGAELLTGGIAGSNTETGTAKHCIASAGTLLGTNAGALSGSYTTGKTAVQIGGGTVQAVYTIGGVTENGVTSLESAYAFDETVLNALNQDEEAAFQPVTGGYPALTWQKIYPVSFELLLDDMLLDPVEAAEYLPVLRPANDPKAMRREEDGTLTEDPTYQFDAWYADSARKTAFDFTAPTRGAKTLYGGWTKDGKRVVCLTLELRTSGVGSVETERRFFTVGEPYEITVPERPGFICFDSASAGTAPETDWTVTLTYYPLGDVNGDGTVDVIDAMLLLRHCVGKLTLEEDALKLADLDGDGSITVKDSLLTLRRALGM